MSMEGPNLPNDVEQLKAMIANREQLLVQRDAVIASQHDTIEKQLKKLAAQEQQLARLLRRQFGPQKERIDPNQLTLFTAEEIVALAKELEQGAQDSVSTDDGRQDDASSDKPSADDAPGTKAQRKGHGRRPIPAHIPREIVVHELNEAERLCPCCVSAR